MLSFSTTPSSEEKKDEVHIPHNEAQDFLPLFITCLDAYYWKNARYPSVSWFSSEFNMTPNEALQILNNPSLQKALSARGLPVGRFNLSGLVKEGSFNGLSPQQVLAANLILNLHDKRSIQAKLKTINVSTNQYSAWLRDANFSEFIKNETNRRFGLMDVEAKHALTRKLQENDLNAVKFFLELTGEYKPNQETQLNLVAIIGQMMEILAKYVSVEILASIANELEGVITPKQIAIETNVKDGTEELIEELNREAKKTLEGDKWQFFTK